jgi:hypothetical protein
MGNIELLYSGMMFMILFLRGRFMYSPEHALKFVQMVGPGLLFRGFLCFSSSRYR